VGKHRIFSKAQDAKQEQIIYKYHGIMCCAEVGGERRLFWLSIDELYQRDAKVKLKMLAE
jgi:hypothetical protein